MAENNTARIAREVLAAREGGTPVLVATVIAAPTAGAARVGAKLLVRRDESASGSLGLEPLDGAVLREAADAFRRHGVETLYLSVSGERLTRQQAEGTDAYQVMIEVHERPASLLVVGGGHVGKALAELGAMCGFLVTVVDDRPEYANAERFPAAERVLCGRFDEVLADYPADENTYAVCVTRGHRHDEISLRAVVGKPAAYIGMIGSKRRVGAVLQHLVETGVDPQAAARVHTPIGLDIGAETPEEIAVAIMAEIIQVRRGGSGRPMKETRPGHKGVAPPERLGDD